RTVTGVQTCALPILPLTQRVIPLWEARAHGMSDEQAAKGGAAAAAASPSKEPKVIKRYTNRKLYDTVESRYVTLDEIAEMIKQRSEERRVGKGGRGT